MPKEWDRTEAGVILSALPSRNYGSHFRHGYKTQRGKHCEHPQFDERNRQVRQIRVKRYASDQPERESGSKRQIFTTILEPNSTTTTKLLRGKRVCLCVRILLNYHGNQMSWQNLYSLWHVVYSSIAFSCQTMRIRISTELPAQDNCL